MKFPTALSIVIFFCLYSYLQSASVEVNVQLATKTAEVSVTITSLSVQFQTAQAAALYQESEYVRSIISELSLTVEQFLVEVQSINARYQTQTEVIASVAIRDSLANIVSYLKTCLTVATTAQIEEITAVTTEVNAVIKIIESVRSALVVYTASTVTTTTRLLSVYFSDKQTTKLTDGISRSSEVLITIVQSLVTRITEDSDFSQLVFSLDFQQAVETGNTVAANTAIALQSRYFEVVSRTSTTIAYTALDADLLIYSGFDASIIVEFNLLGAYAQTRVNSVINLIVRLLISPTTVEDVYVVLGQETLSGLADAYAEIRAEFDTAIQDCREEIESTEPGGNGSQSSSESGGSKESDSDGDNLSMKGEVKKYNNRGKGLMILLQEQYSKSTTAAVCGAGSIVAINARIGVAQTQICTCVDQAIINFRIVLEQVKALIRTEIDVNVEGITKCARESSDLNSSGNGSKECIEESLIPDLDTNDEIETRKGSSENSKEKSEECTMVCIKLSNLPLRHSEKLSFIY